MKNETTALTSVMYTVNTANSYYNTSKVALGVNLREDDEENPYELQAFDISQSINGVKYNAVFLNVSNLNFANEDIELTTEFTYECLLANLIALDSTTNYSSLDNTLKNGALLICMYNFTNDIDELSSYAEALIPMIPQLQTDLNKNGNFQTNLSVLSAEPRKAGISKIRRY